jgi:hypothetical protein
LKRSLTRFVCALVALACLGAACYGASHHPLWPTALLPAVVMLAAVEWRRPGVWLFIVPAGLPWLDFSPWTGWSAFEEFDLLVLATLAGGYASLAWSGSKVGGDGHRFASPTYRAIRLLLLFGAFTLIALGIGVHDAGGWSFSWFQGYTEPLNAVRTAKSTLFGLLALPLIQRDLRVSVRRASKRLCSGMTAGLTAVVLAVLWERAAYPGLLNLSERYRTTALFWEMHVGGAAIDAYVALAAPFVAWALWSARSAARWIAAALLALAATYAGLSTFSRGAYLGVAGGLLLLGVLLLRRREPCAPMVAWLPAWKLRRPASFGWRTLGGALLEMALLAEVLVVLGTSPFMDERLAAADEDFVHRREHWAHGLGLLHTPAEWLFGRGLGRLPAHYAGEVPNGEFSGAVRLDASSAGEVVVTLSGPPTQARLGGLYGLAQRVASEPAYRVRLEARSARPARIHLRVCERHLLYDGRCQVGFASTAPSATAWRHIELPLHGPALTAGERSAWRSALFEVSVLDAGGAVEFRRIALLDPGGADLLANGDFSAGLAHWWPVAQKYFVPWHIDNLYLELLIDRGLPALLVFLALVVLALARLSARAVRLPAAPFLAASLCGALLVGLVSSIFDVPRVAYLLQLLLVFSLLGTSEARQARALVKPATGRFHPGKGSEHVSDSATVCDLGRQDEPLKVPYQ